MHRKGINQGFWAQLSLQRPYLRNPRAIKSFNHFGVTACKRYPDLSFSIWICNLTFKLIWYHASSKLDFPIQAHKTKIFSGFLIQRLSWRKLFGFSLPGFVLPPFCPFGFPFWPLCLFLPKIRLVLVWWMPTGEICMQRLRRGGGCLLSCAFSAMGTV